MNTAFHKISIDFEYLNEIYNINSDPYNTLSELKEIVSKKIFPYPGEVHCFYKNMDLFEKEDEEIIKLFPNKLKISIKLKRSTKDKEPKKSTITRNANRRISILPSLSATPKLNAIVSPEKNKAKRKKKIERLKSISSTANTITNTRPGSRLNIKLREETIKDNIKNNDLFYYMHRMAVDKFKNSKKMKKEIKDEDNESEYNNIVDTYKKMKSFKFFTDKKENKDLNILLSLTKKNLNRYKLDNNFSLDFHKKSTFNNKNNEIPKTEKNILQTKLKKLNKLNLNLSTDEEKSSNEQMDNNIKSTEKETKKEIIDDNYICSSCKNEMITEYCLNCNEFKCNSCIELCNADEHEHFKIKLEEDCFKNINIYGNLITSNINKKLQDIIKFDKELKIYDIKKCRDNLISFINDILNMYNEIIYTLESVYKEKSVKKEMDKFEAESKKIKAEVNDIVQKANSYLKNDNNISKPKYKMMNMQYFFNLLNEKNKTFDSLNQNMKVYSLNFTINSNLEKSFNDIENIIKSIKNKDNPFLLKDDLKKEYQNLIQKYYHTRKNKRKVYMKRKTISIKSVRKPDFEISQDNINDDNNNSQEQ